MTLSLSAVQILTGVVVGVLLLVATVIVVIVVYRKSGYSIHIVQYTYSTPRTSLIDR